MKAVTLRSDAAGIVTEYWRIWAKRDKAAAIALTHPDLLYALYVPESVLPFGGETRGRNALSDRLQTILDVFDTVRYEGQVLSADARTVRGLVSYRFRHKITGEEIDGTLRQEIEVENGLVVSWKEYTDVERVRAFMRLVAYKA